MKKVTATIMLLGALALAGCQTTTEINTIEPAASTKASNAVSREMRGAMKQFEQGNYGLSQKEYKAAVEKHPKNSVAWLGLAASYDKLGRFDLADQAYERLLTLEGRKPAVLNNYGYSYIMRGDLKKARSLLNEARATAPLSAVVEANWKLAHEGNS